MRYIKSYLSIIKINLKIIWYQFEYINTNNVITNECITVLTTVIS